MHGMDCQHPNAKKPFIKKHFIISSSKFKNLLESSTYKQKREELEAANKANLERQKAAGEELAAKFAVHRGQTLDEMQQKQKKDIAKKTAQAAKQIEEYKENDEKTRRNKIKKAETILEKLKPGTRLLHSAAMHSEVLRERNIQKAIKDEFNKVIEDDQERLAKSCVSIENPWIKDIEAIKAGKVSKIAGYKQEVLRKIVENSKEKILQKTRLQAEELAARERIDEEIKGQIEKEKLAMEKKRYVLRQNAIEAMKMVEQRRQRERMVEEVEDRLNCVYNESKMELDKQLKLNKEKKLEDRNKKLEENAKKLPNDDLAQQQKQMVCLARDLNAMELKFTEAELERKRREKASKQARIEAHLQEVERQKKLKQMSQQSQLFGMGQRYKNDEVNMHFVQQKCDARLRKLEEFRNMLKEQMAEKDQKAKGEVDCRLDDPYIKDDQKFFTLARQYIEDAKEKERPLYPFIKAIEQYKRDNQIDCVKTLPKHLISKIAIGCRQSNQMAEVPKVQTDKEKALQECLKTEEILVNGLKDERNRVCVRGGKTTYGVPRFSDLRQEPPNFECQKCIPSKTAGISNSEEDIKARGDGNKIRYSLSHLKYINMYKNN